MQAFAPSIVSNSRRRPPGLSDEDSLHGVPEVLGADGFPGRVADPLAKREPIGQSVGGYLGERRGEVRDERRAVRASDLLVRQEPVVRDRQDLPAERVVEYNDRRDRAISSARSRDETVRVPPRCSAADAPTASHRPVARRSPATLARPPTGTVCSTVSVAGSIALIESSNSFATHREPAAAPSAFGPSPTEIVACSRPVEGSSRETVPSRWFATQIEPNADSTAVGPLPTVCVSVTLGFGGSTRAIPAGATETHTPFGVKATPRGLAGERQRTRTLSDDRIHSEERGADRVGDPQRAVADRDARWPGADAGDRLADSVRLGVDPAHRAVATVRDPHRPHADRDAGGRGADRDRVDDRAGLQVQASHDWRGQAERPTGFRTRSRSRRDADRARWRARGSRPPRSCGRPSSFRCPRRRHRRRRAAGSRWRRARAPPAIAPTTTQRRDVFGGGGGGGAYGRSRSTGSTPSGTTRTTTTGSEMPLNDSEPRSSYPAPSTRRARWVTSRVARISPARAWPQSRAARFRAAPR